MEKKRRMMHVKINKTADLKVDEAIKFAKKLVKDDVLVIRLSKERKKEIMNHSEESGVSMSAYMLMAEHFFIKNAFADVK
ncbi:MAG: hypothetical protein V3S46_05670 [Nitrospinota bacterium]